MHSGKFISIKTLCKIHKVEESFVYTLHEYDILELRQEREETWLHEDTLPLLEKMVRLNRDLNINPEGLQAVHVLLQRVHGLQQELLTVKRKLDALDMYF